MKPKRIISFLLAICLVAGLLPTVSFAADGDKTIMLGTSGISGFDTAKGGTGYDYIYFGSWTAQDKYTTSSSIKWRVLDDQTNFDSDSDGTNDAGLFLLSDVLLGTGADGGVYFNKTSPKSEAWQGSDAQSWCKDFAGIEGNSVTNAFFSAELAAILETTKSDKTYRYFADSEKILNGDKVFFLSAEEAENSAYGFTDDNARIANYGDHTYVWWLRSPNAYEAYLAGLVGNNGSVASNTVSTDWAARPAFNLNLNSVLFTSAAEGGKSPAAESGGNQGAVGADAIFEIGAYTGNEWKLTLLDSSRNFSVTETTASGKPGDTITLNYTGATVYNADTAPNEYISVIIADKSGAQYYGRVAQPTEASGQIQIKIPASLADGTYTLNVFSEQYNGGENDDTKLTDYASAFEAVTLTVDTTAPTLSNGSAIRDSETTATVKFTSDEAGSYYYVVDSNSTAPGSIDTTTTAGTSCKANEETEISIDSLSNGVQYIHIVVKDAVGNVSQPLTIQIPAYTYTLTVNLNGGSGSTTDGQYPAGKVVNIDAGSRSNYRFTGWTTSNDGSFADASSASTTFTMPAADTTITANWTYSGGSSRPSTPSTPTGPATGESGGWEEIGNEIEEAQPGETIVVDMNGTTEVPAEIFEEVAGKDVTVEFDLGGGISWTVNGQDVPTGTSFQNLNLGVEMGTSGISADVINDITGEHGSVQVTLAHDGEFGFAITLTAPLGSDNAGYWANLYYYHEDSETLTFQTSGRIEEDGSVSLRFNHASQYAIVIDDYSHAALPFADVPEGAWYHDAVSYVYTNGLMVGTGDATFSPEISTSRAMIAVTLWRMEGEPAVKGANPYTDVENGAWYTEAITWANENGIAEGYGNGCFQPETPVTREQLAAFFYRYAAYKGYDITITGSLDHFNDKDNVSEWAKDTMAWAVGYGLIGGKDNNMLDPQGEATRAEFAAMLQRFCQKG